MNNNNHNNNHTGCPFNQKLLLITSAVSMEAAASVVEALKGNQKNLPTLFSLSSVFHLVKKQTNKLPQIVLETCEGKRQERAQKKK